MINIKFMYDKGYLVMRMKGHANTGKAGRDLLCSSASTLAITLSAVIGKSFEDGLLDEKPVIDLKEGYSFIKAKPKADSFAEILHSYYVIEQGMAFLYQYQPKHIRLKVFDESIKDCQ